MLAAFFMLCALAAGLTMADDAEACVYKLLVRKFDRAVEQYLADPTPARLAKICGIIARMEQKGYGGPGTPIPPLPPGVVCPPPGAGGGNGRGGAAGGFGGGPGGGGPGSPSAAMFPPGTGPFTVYIFLRNFNDVACTFSWSVTEDPGNPSGFSLSPLSGSEVVPSNTTVLVPLSAAIDPGVPAGLDSFFDVFVTDECTGLDLADDFSRFKVTATSDISIVPVAPTQPVVDDVPFSVSWTVTNHTAGPIVKGYTFVAIPDPASAAELNDGTPYDIQNIFEVSAPFTRGGSISLGAGESGDVDWGPLANGEYCDPQMIGCCALEIDGNLSCVMVMIEDTPDLRDPERFDDLVGSPAGGLVGVTILGAGGPVNMSVPTAPGQDVPGILDRLALRCMELVQLVPNFRHAPVVDEDGIAVMAADDIPVIPFTNDPGLNWKSMNISPVTGTGTIGGLHQVQVEILNNGNPVPGRPVNFFVDGANPGAGNGVTNGSGVANFAYPGVTAGADFIQAVTGAIPRLGPGPFTEFTTMVWIGPSSVDPIPGTGAVFVSAQPNPFRGETTVRFETPRSASVELTLYAADGRMVRHFESREYGPGEHDLLWDGRDGEGTRLPSGTYFYRARVGAEVYGGKVALIE